MRVRGAHHVVAGRRSGTVRWRRAAIVTVTAVVPLAAAVVTAVPASAAGGYAVTATIPVGSGPEGVAADPAAGTVYVTNYGADTVSVINMATNAVTATIAVGSDPWEVAADPAAGTVYVTNRGSNTVSVIDEATNAVTATITVGSDPWGVAVNPAAGIVYVTNHGDSTLSEIDVATNAVTATIPVGVVSEGSAPFLYAVAVDPAAGTVYVTNSSDGEGFVSVIDAATNAVTATFAVGYEGVATDPAAGTVYVISSGSVSVIDAATNTVTATLGVGQSVAAVAVDPAAGTVYVTYGGTGGTCPISAACVSVIDAATNAVTATVPVGTDSFSPGVAVDPSTHTAYVTNYGDDTVSVISPPQAPAITSAGSASIGMRSPADVTVTATGVPAPALTQTGALPSGITFTDNGNGTATLSGIAPAGTAGRYPITITAANGVGSPATQAFTLTVTTKASAPAITSAPAAAATFGQLFSFTVTTNGYPVPWMAKAGTMPPGVHFAGNGDGTATISGTPARTALGPYTVTLTTGNKAGTVTQSFTLTIWKAPVITKIPTTTATIGTPMDLTITATGYDTPVLTESGTLPSGLSFASTGNGQATISGTPAAGTGGSRAITITATNQVGTASQTFTLTVHRS
jgi:YVTN family beta-propeller protein